MEDRWNNDNRRRGGGRFRDYESNQQNQNWEGGSRQNYDDDDERYYRSERYGSGTGSGMRSGGGQGNYGQGQYGRGGDYESGGYGRRSGGGDYGYEDYGVPHRGPYPGGDRDSDYGRGRSGGGERYGRGGGREGGYRERDENRGMWDRATDEVSSWFGDEEAERRRNRDRGHYGKGPKGYARSDSRIAEDVNDRLTEDWQLDASEIEVEVENCEVTLTGTVETREERRRAEDLAESVSGVRHVQNNLRVGQGGRMSEGMGLTSSVTGSTQSSSTEGGKSKGGNR